MTTQTVSLLTPRAAPFNPRGARLAAAAAVALFNAAGRLFGPRVTSASADASADTRAEQAAQVREMALQFRQSDPGYAADLFAAAERHEGRDD